ncbi:dTDP-glucose pyrophosphorylase [Leuconostoc phage LLC-1]|nr:dTDP-glucose pyrophosphorylase [Leuconostoc phage LLC-1]
MNKITLDLTHLRPLTLNKYHQNGIKIDKKIALAHGLNIK